MSEIVCIYSYGYRDFVGPNLPPHGYGVRGAYLIPQKVTDKDGNPRCRWCLGPVEKPRRSWCSQKCVDEYNERAWPVLTGIIKERDGFCRICLRRSYKVIKNRWELRTDPEFYDLPRMERPEYSPLYEYYEVDHIVAVAEGGTDHPDNLRLLCSDCHKQVTREQRARWAAEKREPDPQQAFAL